MKLKSKLLISFLIVIILPLITGIGITYFNIRNSINNLDEKKHILISIVPVIILIL